MKKHFMELAMACMLLVCFYFLSREAAGVSKELSASGKESRVIVVDVGHGGEDPGMIGIGGLEEKGINLSVALKVREELQQKGFHVVMTRDTDTGLYEEGTQNKKVQDLQKRISIIQEANPLLTISIHQNSYPDPSVKGPQVFYYQNSAEGEKLAGFLQDSLNAGLSVSRPRNSKGNTSYYLLKRSPGILNIVECGFLTNEEEAALLQTEEYQKKVAEAISQGVVQYIRKKS